MVKVRVSQIPEQDGQPIRQNSKKRFKTEIFSADNSHKSKDLDEDDDENPSDNSGESDGDEEVKYIKSVIYLKDFGLTLSLFDINTIETDIRFVEKPKARWQYGITINKGMDKSMRFPIVDKSVWFEKEEVRDKRYSEIMKKLEEVGFNVIQV